MLINNEFNEVKVRSPLLYMWKIFKKNNVPFTAMWLAIIFTLIAIFADIIILHISTQYEIREILSPPYWVDGSSSTHILGTDINGKDVLSRLFKGIQLTLGGAIIITSAISILGLIIGVSASLTKGVKASILHHLLDAFLAIPTLLTALVLIAVFGGSYDNILLTVTLSLLPQFIRGIYLSVENELSKQYIISLQLDGATNFRLLRFGILPNIFEPIVTLIIRIFTMAILEISTLGFLGFGSQHLDAELGALIARGIDYANVAPWLIIFPGLVIFIIILVFNIFAEGLRHAIIQVEDD